MYKKYSVEDIASKIRKAAPSENSFAAIMFMKNTISSVQC